MVYTLEDPRTKQVRYVGRTGNPEERYRKHLYPGVSHTFCTPDKLDWARELHGLELRPVMKIVEEVYPPRLVIEREHRWMLSYIHEEAPLTNYQAVYYRRFVQAVRATHINYLREPLRSKAWSPILTAYIKDIAERKELMREKSSHDRSERAARR